MDYPHIVVFPGSFSQFEEAVTSIIRTSEYKKVDLTDSQREWLCDRTKSDKISFRIGPIDSQKGKDLAELKIFSVIEKTDNYTYLMPFHVTRDIDNYFGWDIIELSKYSDKEIYYFWEEHATIGYEKFQNGSVTKSIIEDTHGPRVVVDGQLIFESLGPGKLTIGTGLIDGKQIEVKEIKVETKQGPAISYSYNYSYGYENKPQFFPSEVFDKVKNLFNSHKGPWEIASNTENIILVRKGIGSIEEYIKRKEKEIKSNSIKIGGWLIITLIIIGLIILFKLLKK